MNEEGYLRDLGKTIPSMEGKWDQNKEYERLSIVYVEDGQESSNDNNSSGGGGNNGNQGGNSGNNSGSNNGGNSGNNGNNSGNNGDSGNGGSVTPQPQTTYKVIVNSNLSFDNCTINGTVGNISDVPEGSNVTIVVSKAGYVDKTVTIPNISENKTIQVNFTDEDRVKLTVKTVTNISAWDVNILDDEGNVIESVDGHEFEVDYGASVNVEIIGKDFAYGRLARVTRLENITENKQIIEQYSDDHMDAVVDSDLTSSDKTNWYYSQAIVLDSNGTNGEWRNIYVRNALNGEIWFERLRENDPRMASGVETDLEFRIQTINGEKVIQYKATYVRNPGTLLTYPYAESIGHIHIMMHKYTEEDDSASYNEYSENVEKYCNKYGVTRISAASVAFLTNAIHYAGANRKILPTMDN